MQKEVEELKKSRIKRNTIEAVDEPVGRSVDSEEETGGVRAWNEVPRDNAVEEEPKRYEEYVPHPIRRNDDVIKAKLLKEVKTQIDKQISSLRGRSEIKMAIMEARNMNLSPFSYEILQTPKLPWFQPPQI